MTHAINFVDDCELPGGHDFLFVAVPEGALIFYRESALTPTTLEESWTAYRLCAEDDRNTPTSAKPTGSWPALSLVASA